MNPNENKDTLPSPNGDKKVSDYANNQNIFEKKSSEQFEKNALNGQTKGKDGKPLFMNPFAKNNAKDDEKTIIDAVNGTATDEPSSSNGQKKLTLIACIVGILIVAGIIAALFFLNNRDDKVATPGNKPLFGDEENEWNTPSEQGLTCTIDTTTDKTFGFSGFDSLSIKRNIVFSKADTPLTVASDYMYSFNNENAVDTYFSTFKQMYDGRYTRDPYYYTTSLAKDKSGFLLSINGVVVNVRHDEYLAIFGLVTSYTNGAGEIVSVGGWTEEEVKAYHEAEGYTCAVAEPN